MTDTPTGWLEVTRTRFFIGQAPFNFVDGPARGRQLLNVGTAWTPAAYAVLFHPDQDEEHVYMRRPSLSSWHFEHIRPILNLAEHITCPACGRTSAHPKDLEFGWCSACNAYTQLGTAERPNLGHIIGDVAEIHSGAETGRRIPGGSRTP